jgi:hypothetical protein
MAGGFTFKRCSCPTVTGANGRPLACKRKHGSWFFAAESRTPDGRRRQVRRGGYATQSDAQLALTAFAEARNTGQVTDDRNQTVIEFLNQWLAKKITNGLRPTTARGTASTSTPTSLRSSARYACVTCGPRTSRMS